MRKSLLVFIVAGASVVGMSVSAMAMHRTITEKGAVCCSWDEAPAGHVLGTKAGSCCVGKVLPRGQSNQMQKAK